MKHKTIAAQFALYVSVKCVKKLQRREALKLNKEAAPNSLTFDYMTEDKAVTRFKARRVTNKERKSMRQALAKVNESEGEEEIEMRM